MRRPQILYFLNKESSSYHLFRKRAAPSRSRPELSLSGAAISSKTWPTWWTPTAATFSRSCPPCPTSVRNTSAAQWRPRAEVQTSWWGEGSLIRTSTRSTSTTLSLACGGLVSSSFACSLKTSHLPSVVHLHLSCCRADPPPPPPKRELLALRRLLHRGGGTHQQQQHLLRGRVHV